MDNTSFQGSLLAPVPASERIQLLDILRGFALLGIFLMNIEFFSRSMLDVSTGIEPGLSGVDWLADAFVYVFVRGKFWTLFSLLFGMGFAVMLARAQAAGRPFVALYLRRTLGLLLIGLAHGLFVWSGDILFSYSLAAFAILLLFRDTPTPRLWKWGAALYAVLVLLMLVGAAGMMVVAGDPQASAAAAGPGASAALAGMREQEAAAYASGGYAEANAFRLEFFLHHLGNNVFLVPMVVGMFLVGAWLVRSGAMADPAGHRGLFVRLATWGGILGLALTLWSIAVAPNPAMDPAAPAAAPLVAMALHMAGSPLMALGYTGLVVLAWQAGARWLSVLAPAGRMALTHYLLQSVVGTLLFYGYGLGLWGDVSRAGQTLIVLVVFAVQVAASHWWLARFRFGPFEWLWRTFTYLRAPTMRRAIAAPATA
ncbi:MAG TPA: DUF418 domain-containing protein [Xanthomonadaceae bacterium]|nr:DUF418 domain-containing protein [Xanthomonadaceae bacterium]